MVLVQASKLTLPDPSFISPQITSILFEPNSLSLALMHSDSSISLYPSFYPLSSTSFPPPQTLIPSPSSSSTFLQLQNSRPNSPPRFIFIVSGPYRAGAEILLRFYILRKNKSFSRPQVVCIQKDLRFDKKIGVLVNVKHGVSINLAGSINYFAMHSVSGSKIWVFAVRMEGDDGDGDGVVVKLMKCALIECCKPVWSVSVSFGFLVLGEENGVRVFNIRRIVKGHVWKPKNLHSNSKGESGGLPFQNGVIGCGCARNKGGQGGNGCAVGGGTPEAICNCHLEAKIKKHEISVKQKSVRMRQDEKNEGACFIALKSKEVEPNSITMPYVKVISIQALSQKMWLILDSAGDLHLLCLPNPSSGADTTGFVWQLPHIMKVECSAAFPGTENIWISDGRHSIHMLAAPDIANTLVANDENDNENKLMHLPVIQAIFASEKIQDIIPLAANAFLILGQGSLYAYAIS